MLLVLCSCEQEESLQIRIEEVKYKETFLLWRYAVSINIATTTPSSDTIQFPGRSDITGLWCKGQQVNHAPSATQSHTSIA